MSTIEELLHKLDEWFILGEVTEATYTDLKARLLARRDAADVAAVGGTPPRVATAAAEGGTRDSVVKGDVTATTGAASVGNVNFHVQMEKGSRLIIFTRPQAAEPAAVRTDAGARTLATRAGQAGRRPKAWCVPVPDGYDGGLEAVR